jgi:hypothetical protein
MLTDDALLMTISWDIRFEGNINNLHFSLHQGKPQVQESIIDFPLHHPKSSKIFTSGKVHHVDMVVNFTGETYSYKERQLSAKSYDVWVDGALVVENSQDNYKDTREQDVYSFDFFSIQSFKNSVCKFWIDNIEIREGSFVK